MSLFDTKVESEPKHTNEELYYRQMELLKTFLEHGAFSKEQYDKSSHDLTAKMSKKIARSKYEQSIIW